MLKATGIVRKIDHMGRIVLPASLRKNLSIKHDDAIELLVGDDGEIILQKYKPRCIFCGSTDDIVKVKEKDICKNCQQELKQLR